MATACVTESLTRLVTDIWHPADCDLKISPVSANTSMSLRKLHTLRDIATLSSKKQRMGLILKNAPDFKRRLPKAVMPPYRSGLSNSTVQRVCDFPAQKNLVHLAS